MKKLLFLLLLICQFAKGQNIHTFPTQTNNVNKMLSTNGTGVAWNFPLNWKAFPGVGDSSTDNSSIFQSYIDGCDSTPSVIYIGFGKFKFNSGVHTHSYSRITFIGAGGIALDGTDTGHIWNRCNTRLIKNLTGYLITDSAFQASNFLEIGFEDQVHNPTSGGFINALGFFPKYKECSFVNGFNGVLQQNATYSFFDHCNFGDLVNYGIYNFDLYNADQGDMTVTNCNFSVDLKTTVAMIYQNSSGGTKITNCKWNGIGTVDCIYLNMTASTSDLFCANNSFENFTGYAVHIDVASGVTFYNTTILGGNISSYRGGSGIYLDASQNHFGISGISVSGVRFNNLNRGILGAFADNVAMSGNTYDTATISVLFSLAGCTRIYDDRQTATVNQNGLMEAEDRKYLDTLEGNGGITQFFHTTSVQDTSVFFTFYGSDNDIADQTPNINVPGGSFTQLFGGASSIASNGGYGFIHTEGGTTGYLINSGSTTFDVSIKFLASTMGSGIWQILARGADYQNYLSVYISTSDISVGELIAGSGTSLYDLGSNPLVDNDAVHLQVNGNAWKLLINSDSVSSGTFNGATLSGATAGMLINSGTQDTHFTNFLITSIPDVNGGWGVITDGNTITGTGLSGDPLVSHSNADSSVFATKYGVDTMRTRINASLASGSTSDGIFLPTATIVGNIATLTGDSAIYTRVGNSVIVDGHVTLTPTSGSSNCQFTVAFPVNSPLFGGHACFGSASTSEITIGGNGSGDAGIVFSSGSSSNTATVTLFPPGITSSVSVNYHYQYRVQ